jgi:hypothetical protein
MTTARLTVEPAHPARLLHLSLRPGSDRKLLARKNPPTAIFASNDDRAAAAVSVAHRRGLDVPRDLSVVGFDDTPRHGPRPDQAGFRGSTAQGMTRELRGRRPAPATCILITLPLRSHTPTTSGPVSRRLSVRWKTKVTTSRQAPPPWTLGIAQPMRNLARRGLLPASQ